MEKIDIHAHILPECWPSFEERFGYKGWITLKHLDTFSEQGFRQSVMLHDDGRVFRPVDDRVYSVERRLQEMDRTGVSRQVISPVPVMFNYWAKAEHNEIVSRFLNDHTASVIRQYPDRFLGLGTVPLQDIELAVKELIRCKHDLNLNGLIIGTHVNQRTLDEQIFEPFWRAAEEHSMPLLIHPWDVCKANGRWTQFLLPYVVGMTGETTAAALSLAVGGVLERHRKLRICLAHGGGALPYLNQRADLGFHVYPAEMQGHVRRSPNYYLKQSPNVCADTLVHDTKAFQLAMSYFGEDSLMLGSDYPFLLGEAQPGSMIEKCPISFQTKQKLLCSNALKFFSQ